jgi:DNA-binding CsgD family transcriptional regulator
MDTKATTARESIAELSAAGLGTVDLLREVGERIRRVVPYMTTAYMGTDPATLLPTTLYHHSERPFDVDIQKAYFDNEYLHEDYVKVAEVARMSRGVQTRSEATGGDLDLSRRHREIHPQVEAEHEMRVVFRSAGAVWGCACVSREIGAPDFTEEEQDFIVSIADDVGDGLRLATKFDMPLDPAPAGDPAIPGIVVLSGEGRVESITPEAQEWLTQFDEVTQDGLPLTIHNIARVARARALGAHLPGPARGRRQLASGTWLLIRATELRGDELRIAVILEPARRAELAPLIVLTYELSAREREVTELLLRGLPIEAIASDLSISRHTVRDHTKAIFTKLGVTSRPELTAKLYHEHSLPDLKVAV